MRKCVICAVSLRGVNAGERFYQGSATTGDMLN